MQISLHEVAGQTLRVGIRRGDEARAPLLMFNGIGANIELVEPFLDRIDLLLVMTVHPGFGGQAFRADQMPKVKRALECNKTRDRKIDIEVDGGINAETARVSIQNGANVLVAGTAIFKTNDYAKAIRDLRGS